VVHAVRLAPPRPRHSGPSNLSYWFGYLVNELPFLAVYWLVGSTALAFTEGDVDSSGGWVVVGLAAVTTAGLVVVAWRGSGAGLAVDQALREGLGAGWRGAIDAGWPPGCAAAFRGPGSCWRRCRLLVATSSGSPTSATATRASGTGWTSTGIAPARRAVPRWCTCTGGVPQRQEAPGGAAAAVPARQPGLGVRQR
jgi:hypothetical protein